MSLTQLNFAGKNMVEVSIMRLKEFEPPEGYFLAFSGGKDSVVIYHLAVAAGVKFDAHYNRTGIDPPSPLFVYTVYVFVYFSNQVNYSRESRQGGLSPPCLLLVRGLRQGGFAR